jgi:hypothetical protein
LPNVFASPLFNEQRRRYLRRKLMLSRPIGN